MSKESSCLVHVYVQNSVHFGAAFEEILKDLVGIIGKSVPSFELSICMQSFLESLIAIFIEISSFDGIREDLIGLSAGTEHLLCNLGIFLGGFGRIAKSQFSIGFWNVGGRSPGIDVQGLIVVCYHL